jgi:hypothetical protein
MARHADLPCNNAGLVWKVVRSTEFRKNIKVFRDVGLYRLQTGVPVLQYYGKKILGNAGKFISNLNCFLLSPCGLTYCLSLLVETVRISENLVLAY